MDLALSVVLAATSICSAVIALMIMAYLRPRPVAPWGMAHAAAKSTVFLFDDTKLVDASDNARALFENGCDRLTDWQRLVSLLEARFPEFERAMATLPDTGSVKLQATGDASVIEAEWLRGVTRIELLDRERGTSDPDLDQHNLATISDELRALRGVVNEAPLLIWKEDVDGGVRWANAAYLEIADRFVAEDEPMGWPLPQLFEKLGDAVGSIEDPLRLCLTLPGDDDPIWFDCVVETHGEERIFFGFAADRLVQAEASLREFVQTLTKTFAHLPTGLAVFDKERRLALFNPALTDLSGLEPLFLSARPSLFEFLDKLRERQRMPEPKDYKSWRKQISEMESAASSGTHQEFWTLPSGQTYRITGRPHPDGAVAFLFEDITSEVSLTRQFRSDLELWQSVVDSLDEAVAVFSRAGVLELSNAAYAELWDCAAADTLGQMTVIDATRNWQTMCEPTPIWGDFRDFVDLSGERTDWTALVRRKDGRLISCRFVPLAGHATLAAFSLPEDVAGSARPKLWTSASA